MQHNIQGFNIIFTVSTYSAVSFVFIYPTVNFLPCSFLILQKRTTNYDWAITAGIHKYAKLKKILPCK